MPLLLTVQSMLAVIGGDRRTVYFGRMFKLPAADSLLRQINLKQYAGQSSLVSASTWPIGTTSVGKIHIRASVYGQTERLRFAPLARGLLHTTDGLERSRSFCGKRWPGTR